MPGEWHCESMTESRTDIVIRRAVASDARALWRLAALDSAPAPLAGPGVLVAEVNGRIVAAFDHARDRVVADPFRPTAGFVDLLRLRAGQHAADARDARRARTRQIAPQPLPQV